MCDGEGGGLFKETGTAESININRHGDVSTVEFSCYRLAIRDICYSARSI